MCSVVWMGWVSTRVSFSQTRKARTVWGLAPLLPRQEFCHRKLDPQQLVARLRHHALTNHMDFANSVNLQLVRMSFVNHQFVRTTFVTLRLVRMAFVNFVNLQIVQTTLVNLAIHQLVRMTLGEFPARTHDFCESPARTNDKTVPLTS